MLALCECPSKVFVLFLTVWSWAKPYTLSWCILALISEKLQRWCKDSLWFDFPQLTSFQSILCLLFPQWNSTVRGRWPGPWRCVCTLREDQSGSRENCIKKGTTPARCDLGWNVSQEKGFSWTIQGRWEFRVYPGLKQGEWNFHLLSWSSVEGTVTPGGNINSQMSQVLCMFNQGGSRSLKVVPPIRVIMGFTKSTWKLEEATQKWWQGLERIWSVHQWCLLPSPNVYLRGDI